MFLLNTCQASIFFLCFLLAYSLIAFMWQCFCVMFCKERIKREFSLSSSMVDKNVVFIIDSLVKFISGLQLFIGNIYIFRIVVKFWKAVIKFLPCTSIKISGHFPFSCIVTMSWQHLNEFVVYFLFSDITFCYLYIC